MFNGALRNACRSVHRSLHRNWSNKRYFSSTGALRKFDGDGKTTVSVLNNKADLRSKINGFSQGPKKGLTVSTASSFESTLKASMFVDKTLFIKTVFQLRNVGDEHPNRMVTAPRRFGKSVNLDMLARFLELQVDKNTGKRITDVVDLESGTVKDTPNYTLFSEAKTSEGLHLQIMADEEFVKTHFGKYPIINVNFLCSSEVRSETDALNLCKESIHNAFRKHPYLYENSESKLKVDERYVCKQWCTKEGEHENRNYEQFKPNRVINGLKDLSEYLHKFHGRKVFVLIDEFDSIVAKAVDTVTDKRQLKSIIELVIGVIGKVVKDNSENLGGVLITGILDLHGSGISTILGNVGRETFGEDRPLLKYYGFNLEEVKKLFEIFSIDEGLRKKAITKYNGYYTKRGEHGIFNPYAIAKFLEMHEDGDASLQNYWQETGYVQSLDNLFKNDTIRKMIQSMLLGMSFPMEDEFVDYLNLENLTDLHEANRDSLAYISEYLVALFLLRQGYLSYIPRRESPTVVGIPDDLISTFKKKMEMFLTRDCGINKVLVTDCQSQLNNMMHFANKGKPELINALKSFTGKLGEVIGTSSIDPCNEAGIEGIIFSVLIHAGYTSALQVYNIQGNRLDVITHKGGQGIIIELKYDKGSSCDALTQLLTKRYCNNFRNEKHYPGGDIKLRLVMGLHFTEKIKGSQVKATVHCLRDVEINEVLDALEDGTQTEILIEDRIKNACAKEGGVNSFVQKAICVT